MRRIYKSPTNKENLQLTLVSSPAQSHSPFKKIMQKPKFVQCNNYYMRKPNNLIDDTINKLNFLEDKIARIMQKNDQLRTHLKRDDSTHVSKTSKYTDQSRISRKPTLHNPIDYSSLMDTNREDTSKSRVLSKVYSQGKFVKSTSQSRILQVQNGRGKKIYENGCIYEGDFVNGLRQGNGTFMNSQQQIIYQGQWDKDQFNGKGRFVNQDYQDEQLSIQDFKEFKLVQHQFKTYEGEFRNGQFWGFGVMVFKGDQKTLEYSGEFAQDTFHGPGNVSDQLIGKWLYGCFV